MITHASVENYTKHLLKYKSLNKKINKITDQVLPHNEYHMHLLKSAVIVGANIIFMRGMFRAFKMDKDTSDVIAVIETCSNVITVYQILKKLGN